MGDQKNLNPSAESGIGFISKKCFIVSKPNESFSMDDVESKKKGFYSKVHT